MHRVKSSEFQAERRRKPLFFLDILFAFLYQTNRADNPADRQGGAGARAAKEGL
jgi:hypothetical protein